MEDGILQVIDDSEIPLILEEFKKGWPRHFLFHQFLTVRKGYKKDKKECDQILYRFGPIKGGVYLLHTLLNSNVVSEPDNLFFVYTTSTDLSELTAVLTKTTVIPWSKRLCFEIIPYRFVPAILEAAAAKQEVFNHHIFLLLYLPPETEIDIGPLPDDIYWKNLEESHAAEKDTIWTYKSAGSKEYLTQQVKNNYGIGIFRKSDDKMLSSALSYHCGGIFVLQTDAEHRNKGYASIVIKLMAQECREREQMPFCSVAKENLTSLKVFRKLGFVEMDEISWVEKSYSTCEEMGNDILEAVDDSEIPLILEELKKDWPNHFLFHQFLTIRMEYKEAKKVWDQTLFRYGPVEDGVYLLQTLFNLNVVPEPENNFFVYTTSADLTKLTAVLTETTVIPWSQRPLFFEIIPNRLVPAILEAAAAKQEVLDVETCSLLYLPPETEIDIGPLPKDVYVKRLDESHAAEKDEIWIHRSAGSKEYLTQQIKNNFGIGIFQKDNDKMLSSALSFHFGGIFVLQTHPEHRNKGYATMVVKLMAQECRRKKQVPFCTVAKENLTSLKIFIKLGFVEMVEVCWVDKSYSSCEGGQDQLQNKNN